MNGERIRRWTISSAGTLAVLFSGTAAFAAGPARQHGVARTFDKDHAAAPAPGGTRVSDAAQLQAAIRNAVGGEVILLETADYGDLAITGRSMPAEVTLRAAPSATPSLGLVSIQNSAKWRLDGLHIRPRGTGYGSTGYAVNLKGSDLTIENCRVDFADDTTGWTADQWLSRTGGGIQVNGPRAIVRGNTIRSVAKGILSLGPDALVSSNTIADFRADGMVGNGDNSVFEYNVVKNSYKVDDNHTDGFQSFVTGAGEIVGLVLRGNLFISYEDPFQPLRGDIDGIGLFDGMYRDWVIENNVVITGRYHGISILGGINSRIVNNTVVDQREGDAVAPLIEIVEHKDGRRSSGCLIRNNLAPRVVTGAGVVADHNMAVSDLSATYVDPDAFDLRLKPGSPAIDAGTSALAPAVDGNGVARPQGAGVDVGAYEFASALLPLPSPSNIPPVAGAMTLTPGDVTPGVAGAQAYAGREVALKAIGNDPNGDALTWQLLYSVNWGPETIHRSGAGTTASGIFQVPADAAGSVYAWKARFSDGRSFAERYLLFDVIRPAEVSGLDRFPNLFNPSQGAPLEITYKLVQPEMVEIKIFDRNKRLVRSLFRAELSDGPHRVSWDGKNDEGSSASSGVYLLMFRAGTRKEIKKIVLIK